MNRNDLLYMLDRMTVAVNQAAMALGRAEGHPSKDEDLLISLGRGHAQLVTACILARKLLREEARNAG